MIRAPPSVWLGVDDTDSRLGGCTTYVAYRLVEQAEADLIGYPRLVRLNPNVPWKTRGNGALCLRFGRGSGAPRLIGRHQGRPLLAYPTSRCAVDPEDLLDRLWAAAEALDGGFQPEANPAFFATLRRPPPSLYWRAVRSVVTVREYAAIARTLGWARTRNGSRGIVGAVAATAWRPRDRTYEAIAYREATRWGTPRKFSGSSVREMDLASPGTFNSYDWQLDRPVLAPHSPCPVLLGVRGESPEDVAGALGRIRSERVQGWLTFLSNQGTDDHVTPNAWPEARSAVSITGTVDGPPRTLPGGHVTVGLRGRVRLLCLAYEPGKTFRDIVRSLLPGDEVTAVGSIRGQPRGMNLEKIRVLRLVPHRVKLANPLCACGRKMRSAGTRAGYRCRSCGRHATAAAATYVNVPRGIAPGWYEPPPGARRHIAKPLKRMGLGDAWGPQATVDRISMPIGST